MNDIRSKKPTIVGARVATMRLTRQERFVMARIDGERSVDELAGVTGLAPEHLEAIVHKLAEGGALHLDEARPSAAAPMPASDEDGGETGPLAPPPRPRKIVVRRRSQELPALVVARDSEEEDPPTLSPTRASDDDPPSTAPRPEPVTQLDAHEGADEPIAPADAATETETDEEDAAGRALAEKNHRHVYEQRWHPLPADQRVSAARIASGNDLFALCFDADARVIVSILENATAGLDHVRLIALHHRTSTGLEHLARRHDWLRDALVERRLLRNPMIGDVVLGRIMGPKRLLATYKVAIDRDLPELSRVKCRGMVRQKWSTTPSEERADFLLRTEGRCLQFMTGCTFDAKTTAILCGRPINSAMFVQSIAKFAAAPPALLAHFVKQPFVRKNVALKKMLMQHPNLPGDAKRSL